MRKRTESLTFPKDPLATMRELQDMNTSHRTETPPEQESQSAGGLPAPVGHPLQEAILQLLAAPYPPTLTRGPFTVTSVKIHTEIWNRVGLAATLIGRPKQEILAEALRNYLDTLCKTPANAWEAQDDRDDSALPR